MRGARLTGLHPEVRERADWALAVAEYFNVPVTVTSGFRSTEAQARLYRNYQRCLQRGDFGRTPECQFPAAPPGTSAHEYGLAWDSVTEPEFQDWWTYVREYAGFRVLRNDIIHAEVPGWRDLIQTS